MNGPGEYRFGSWYPKQKLPEDKQPPQYKDQELCGSVYRVRVGWEQRVLVNSRSRPWDPNNESST